MNATTQTTSQKEFRKVISDAPFNSNPVKKDWGFTINANSELEALRLAYAYKNSPHGVQVRFAEGIGKFQVTVFNEFAASLGVDRS